MIPDSEPRFRVDSLRSGAMAIIAPRGELDISGQPRLTAKVDEVLTGQPLVLGIDLRGLTFMDSSGIHVMVTAGRRCRQLGRRFFLIRGGPQIDRLLAASGLEDYFETVDEPDRLADGALAAGAGY